VFACVGDSSTDLPDGGDASIGSDAPAETTTPQDGGTTADASDAAVEAGFNPKSVSGLRLWFEADHGVDVSDAGSDAGPNVVTWHDQSGNADDAVPNVNTSFLPACPPPQLVADVINGLAALSFTPLGAQQYPCLQLPSGFSDFTTGATVFTVARIDIAQAQTDFLAFALLQSPNTDPASPLYQVGFRRGTNTLYMENWQDMDAGDYSTLTSAANSAGNPHEIHMYEHVLNAGTPGTTATGAFFLDGNSLGAGTDTKPMIVPTVSVRTMNTIGWSGRTADQVYGYIAEILMYGGPLKTSDRIAVEQYLRAKWATP
jgi:hypothetical protein